VRLRVGGPGACPLPLPGLRDAGEAGEAGGRRGGGGAGGGVVRRTGCAL
jgi:hypothetical protein